MPSLAQEEERKAFVEAVTKVFGGADNAMDWAFDTEKDDEFGFALWQAGKQYGLELQGCCDSGALREALENLPRLELDDDQRLLGKSILAYHDWLVKVANLLHPSADIEARPNSGEAEKAQP